MGVPSFYRWLANKYPTIVVDAVEHKPTTEGDVIVPVDTSQANPNGTEYDNVYLDMNGIIHPATHPEDKPAPKDEAEMMQNICGILDRIFVIVRPRKLVYMAVDGVAPRAKMNQQRSRRFKAAQEAQEAARVEARLREEARANGIEVAEPDVKNKFDSNTITPGTPFMKKVSECLMKYCAEHLATDPGWKDVKVIISDASVPGEGEHKIMHYIRTQRAQPDYDANLKHVVVGLDADLIMLGLSTHEPYFSILREEVMNLNVAQDACHKCKKRGHKSFECTADLPPVTELPYQFLRLDILREYLDREFSGMGWPDYNLERVIDDFIFFCFFVGNDFLPHMPTLEIREGAIDLLMSLYKKVLPNMGGYITEPGGEVDFSRAKVIMGELAFLEDSILIKRRRNEEHRKRRESRGRGGGRGGLGTSGPTRAGFHGGPSNAPKSNQEAAMSLKASFRPASSSSSSSSTSSESSSSTKVGDKRSRDEDKDTPPSKKVKGEDGTSKEKEAEEAAEPEDEVKLGEEGYRDRYYQVKLHFKGANCSEVDEMCYKYVEGLAWVMKYYYRGCVSWNWYFPYHYAPFAQDITRGMASFKSSFELAAPFKPFQQLMAVLPAKSHRALPEPYHKYMGVGGKKGWKSPIAHLYPDKFPLDMNGKKFEWQAVVLLPFIDEKELLTAIAPCEAEIDESETLRNTRGDHILVVNTSNPLVGAMAVATKSKKPELLHYNQGGINGSVSQFKKLQKVNFGNIVKAFDHAVACVFEDPTLPANYVYSSDLLPNLIPPPTTLDKLPTKSYGFNHGQNTAAIRMINSSLPDNQHKSGHNRSEYGYSFNNNNNQLYQVGGDHTGYIRAPPQQFDYNAPPQAYNNAPPPPGGYRGRGGNSVGGYRGGNSGGHYGNGGGYRGGAGGHHGGGDNYRGGNSGGNYRGGGNSGDNYRGGGNSSSGRGGGDSYRGGRGGHNNAPQGGGYRGGHPPPSGGRGGSSSGRGGHNQQQQHQPPQQPAHFSANYNPFAGRR